MHALLLNILMVLTAYLLGSIPFGYLLTKVAGLGDIRQIGSGNIGATNVLRTGNKKLAVLTLLLDGLKGIVAVLIAKHFFPGIVQAAALAAVLGHIFPVWLKFKGGKGVVTTVGVLIALAPPAGIATMLTWGLVARISRLSSLAALIAIGLSPAYIFVTGHANMFMLSVVLLGLVFLKHAPNIQRLRQGNETRIGEKVDKPDATPPSQ